MGVFNKAVVTAKGNSLISKAILSDSDIAFTRMVLSDAELSGDLTGITDLDNIKQSEPIAYVGIKNDTTIACEVAFSNMEITAGYYVKVVGLYATDPDEGEILYCISTASTADWMPPFSNGVCSYLVNVVTAVANSENVSINVDPTAYVTKGQLLNIENQLGGKENRLNKIDDFNKIDVLSNEQYPTAKAVQKYVQDETLKTHQYCQKVTDTKIELAIGDIETALDAIIEIQNGLLGGATE